MNLPKWMFILCALAFISNYSKGGFIAKKRKEKKRKGSTKHHGIRIWKKKKQLFDTS